MKTKLPTVGLRALTIGAMVLLTALILLNSGVGVLTNRSASKDYLDVIENIDEFARLAAQCEAHLLAAEYWQMQFAMERREEHAERSQGFIDSARTSLYDMRMIDERADLESTDHIDNILIWVDAYETKFNLYVDTLNLVGHEDESGLRGKVNSDAEALISFLRIRGYQSLLGRFLEARLVEQDILSRVKIDRLKTYHGAIDAVSDEIGRLPTPYRSSAQALLDAYKSSVTSEINYVLQANNHMIALQNAASNVFPTLEGLVSDAEEIVAASLANVDERRRSGIALIFIVAAVSLFSAATAVLLVVFRMRGPLKAILEVTDAMAEGRLDLRSNPVRMDELGKIGANVDRAADSIADLIRTIQIAATEGTEIGDGLRHMAGQTASSIEQITASINSIDGRSLEMQRRAGGADEEISKIMQRLAELTGAVSDQAASVAESTAAVEEMASSIKNVDAISGEKNKAAEELAAFSRHSQERVRQVDELIDEITRLAEGMAEVISIINNVASRTNLLAMNAAIEAAHAGDAGRGFAVVADEIRNLAESTSRNARRINESLGTMSDKIHNVSEASRSTISTMAKMSDDVGDFTRSFSEISSSMSEMSTGALEMLKSSDILSSLTQRLDQAFQDMTDQAGSAHDSMGELMNLVGQVSDSVREIGQAGKDINASAVELANEGERNLSIMGRLGAMSGEFVLDQDEPLFLESFDGTDDPAPVPGD